MASAGSPARAGAACDDLIGARLVTAAGDLLEVDSEGHPDLLWVLRGGGGGNFGVVTTLRFRLHPIGETVFAGANVYPGDHAEVVLEALREVAADAPECLGLAASVQTATSCGDLVLPFQTPGRVLARPLRHPGNDVTAVPVGRKVHPPVRVGD